VRIAGSKRRQRRAGDKHEQTGQKAYPEGAQVRSRDARQRRA